MRVTAWEYACDWPRINEEQSVSSAKDGTAFMGLTRIRHNYWAFKGAFFGSNQLEVRRGGCQHGEVNETIPPDRAAQSETAGPSSGHDPEVGGPKPKVGSRK